MKKLLFVLALGFSIPEFLKKVRGPLVFILFNMGRLSLHGKFMSVKWKFPYASGLHFELNKRALLSSDSHDHGVGCGCPPYTCVNRVNLKGRVINSVLVSRTNNFSDGDLYTLVSGLHSTLGSDFPGVEVLHRSQDKCFICDHRGFLSLKHLSFILKTKLHGDIRSHNLIFQKMSQPVSIPKG